MRVEFLQTVRGGQRSLGFIELSDDELVLLPAKESDRTALKNIAADAVYDRGRVIAPGEDPKEWMKALPRKYSGSYLRARLDGSLQEAEDPDGRWATINGTHVFIGDDGTIMKGPSHMIGHKPDDIPNDKGAAGKKSSEKPSIGVFSGEPGTRLSSVAGRTAQRRRPPRFGRGK